MIHFIKYTAKKYHVVCSEEGCDRPYEAKNLCRIHYRRYLGRLGAYKRQYYARKDTPEYKAMKRESDKKIRERIKASPILTNKQRKYNRAWAAKPENRAKKKAYQDAYYLAMRIQVIAHYSNNTNLCKQCGYDNIIALDIDHINNDGAEHKKTMKDTLTSWLIKHNLPSGYQVLCKNCNWIKFQLTLR